MAGSSGNVWAAIGDAAVDIYGQRVQNAANKAAADKQMNFQRDMSNTAHQREVNDLRLAGLNPMLSVNSGSSTPSGAQYTAVNEFGGVQNSAKAILRMNQEMKNMKNMEDKIKADTDVSKTQADLNQTADRTGQTVMQIREMERKILQNSLPGAQLKGTIDAMKLNAVTKGVSTAKSFGSAVKETWRKLWE